MQLPIGYTMRAAMAEDAAACAALLRAFDRAETPDDITAWTAEDIRADWGELDLTTNSWLILAANGMLAGFATLLDEGQGSLLVDGYVHPEHTHLGLGTALVQATEARAQAIVDGLPATQSVTLINNVVATSPTARDLMAAQGYHQTRIFWRMRIDMTAAPTAPQWPAGIRTQICGGAEDIRRAYEVFEAAFADHWGHIPVDFTEWQHCHTRVGFDPSLWFLAWAGDQVAGVALCRRREEGTGWVNTLAVARSWRGQGLGSALLQEAFGAFWQRGVTSVGLGVDAESLTGAQRLYERAGMRVVTSIARYEKIMRSVADLGVQTMCE